MLDSLMCLPIRILRAMETDRPTRSQTVLLSYQHFREQAIIPPAQWSIPELAGCPGRHSVTAIF